MFQGSYRRTQLPGNETADLSLDVPSFFFHDESMLFQSTQTQLDTRTSRIVRLRTVPTRRLPSPLPWNAGNKPNLSLLNTCSEQARSGSTSSRQRSSYCFVMSDVAMVSTFRYGSARDPMGLLCSQGRTLPCHYQHASCVGVRLT